MNSNENATITEAVSQNDSSACREFAGVQQPSSSPGELRIWAVIALVFALAAVRLLGRGTLRLEDAQTLLLPLMLLAVWGLKKHRKARIPGSLLICGLLLWGLSAAHVRGYVPGWSSANVVYLARLQNDPQGDVAQRFFSEYNHIAQTYELPELKLLQRRFKTEDDVRFWLERNRGVLLVLTGDHEWLQAVLPSLDRLLNQDRTDTRGLDPRSIVTTGLHPVALEVAAPLSIPVPKDPPVLSEHFLAWLACGLSRHVESCSPLADADGQENISRLQFRRAAFDKALSARGPWKSGAPLGLAAFYAGTVQMLEPRTPENTDRALAYFRTALRFANRKQAPDLTAAAFNNAAVVKLASSSEAADVKQAFHWLRRAVRHGGLRQRRGLAPSAKIAAENLRRLQAAQMQFTASAG